MAGTDESLEIPLKIKEMYDAALDRFVGKFKVAGIAAATGISAATASIVSMTQKTAALGTELAKWSVITGVQVDKLSEARFITEQLGGDTEKLYDVLKETAVRMKEAQDGVGPLKDNLLHLGIEFQNLDGSLRDSETVFWEIVNALRNMEDAALRTAIADEIWSDAGTELLPVLMRNKEEIEGLRREAHELGMVFDNETSKAAKEYTKNMKELKTQFNSLSVEMGNVFIPVFSNLADRYTKFFKWLRAVTKSDHQKLTFQELNAAIDTQRTEIEKLTESLKDRQKYTSIERRVMEREIAQRKEKIELLNEERLKLLELDQASSTGLGGKSAATSGETKQETREDPASWYKYVYVDSYQKSRLEGIKMREELDEQEFQSLMKQQEREEEERRKKEEALENMDAERRFREEAQRKEDLENEKRNAILKSHAQRQSGMNTISFLESMNTLAKGKHRELFEALKIARTADAIVNTYGAANQAMNSGIPYPWNLIAAGTTIAAGLANVAVIQSQQFGGGGSAGRSTAGGGPTSYTPPLSPPPAPEPSGGTTNVTVNITGATGKEDWNAIVEEQIIPAINTALDRNAANLNIRA